MLFFLLSPAQLLNLDSSTWAWAQEVPPKEDTLSRTKIEAALTAVRSEIEKFPDDLSKDPGNKLRRISLKRRGELLQEYLELMAKADGLASVWSPCKVQSWNWPKKSWNCLK